MKPAKTIFGKALEVDGRGVALGVNFVKTGDPNSPELPLWPALLPGRQSFHGDRQDATSRSEFHVSAMDSSQTLPEERRALPEVGGFSTTGRRALLSFATHGLAVSM